MQARSGFDSNFTSYDYMAIVGQSLGLIYGYEFDGIYQYSDFYSVPGSSTLILKEGVTSNPSLGNRLSPGAVKYKDQDGDGVITTKDRTVIGNALPNGMVVSLTHSTIKVLILALCCNSITAMTFIMQPVCMQLKPIHNVETN